MLTKTENEAKVRVPTMEATYVRHLKKIADSHCNTPRSPASTSLQRPRCFFTGLTRYTFEFNAVSPFTKQLAHRCCVNVDCDFRYVSEMHATHLYPRMGGMRRRLPRAFTSVWMKLRPEPSDVASAAQHAFTARTPALLSGGVSAARAKREHPFRAQGARVLALTR